MIFVLLIIEITIHVEALVISNKLSFDTGISYVDAGYNQITFFLKNDMSSNSNKVVLMDISTINFSTMT